MTVDVTTLEQEIKRLEREVESERFKQSYAAELILKEQNQVKEQAARLETQQTEMTELREALNRKGRERGVKVENQAEYRPKNQKVAELMAANQQLKTELSLMQQSVGEVMLLAQQQGSEMVEKADKKVEMTIEGAKQELLDIGFKAGQLNKEVKESKEQVVAVYDELTLQLSQLTEKDFSL